MTSLKRPNVFVVGAPKCGTTTLVEILDQNDSAFVSNPKELNFFSSQYLLEQGLYYSDVKIDSIESYLNIFSGAKDHHKILVDGSVSYLFYPGVPRKIYEFNPEAKIIVLTRNPVDRAISHYQMDYRLGHVKVSLEEIFNEQDKYPLNYQQYFELGLYGSQVTRYLEIFPRNQVLVLPLNLLKNDVNLFLEKLSDFLGIDFDYSLRDVKRNQMKTPRNKLISSLYKSAALRRVMGLSIFSPIREFLNELLFSSRKEKEVLSEIFRQQLADFFSNDQALLKLMEEKELFLH